MVDFAFKQLFGKPGNESILMAFLNAALKLYANERITSIEYLNPEMEPRHLEDKRSILDIHAQTENRTRINIEIQLTNRFDMEKRTLYYWSNMYASQMRKGMPYTELAKTIAINILNFRYVKASDRYHTTFHLYEDTERFVLTDLLEIHFMEIPKLMVNWRKQTVNLHEDMLVRWLLLLEADENEEIRRELEAIAMQDPEMKRAFEEWEEISRDAHAWAEYESRRKAILDEAAVVREAEIREQRARQEGRQEGQREAKLDMVRSLLSYGVDMDAICKASGLTRQEVEEVKRHLQ